MFLFGLVTICQGLVQNFSGLIATRFFLGLAETGMFPGIVYTYREGNSYAADRQPRLFLPHWDVVQEG